MRGVIVDFGMGNLMSLAHKLRHVPMEMQVSARPEDVLAADRLILPGVGHFARAMANLQSTGLCDALEQRVRQEGVPLLGICCGMQLLARRSEEGETAGLGWIDAEVKRFAFPAGEQLPVPHIGWQSIRPERTHALWREIAPGQRFYFIHSFHMICHDPEDVLATADYGGAFVCAVERGPVCGVQFHPEKSHREGVRVIENFLLRRERQP